MKRRDFLKSFAIVSASSLMPIAVPWWVKRGPVIVRRIPAEIVVPSPLLRKEASINPRHIWLNGGPGTQARMWGSYQGFTSLHVGSDLTLAGRALDSFDEILISDGAQLRLEAMPLRGVTIESGEVSYGPLPPMAPLRLFNV